MELWSTAFLAHPVTDSATCFVEQDAWREIQGETTERYFGRISAGEKEWICALGAPVVCELPQRRGARQRIFLPHAMLVHLGLEGAGEYVDVEWLPAEAFPEATMIRVRPHDSAFYHADAKEELERHLTMLGVIQAGSTVLVPLQALGGFEVAVDILATEPANIVLAQGDEVAIDFAEALDTPAAPAAAPVAAAQPVPEPFEEFEPMIESGSVATATAAAPGHVLGGTNRRMADGRAWNPWR